MSKIKNGGLDQYGTEPYEQQQFGAAGVKGVKGIGGERVNRLNDCRSPLQLSYFRTYL